MAKKRPDLVPDEGLVSNPFAALAGLRQGLPPGEAPAAAEVSRAGAGKLARGPARAVVRYQRKGRGGKEATLVEQLTLDAETLELWCREFKRILGCGGNVDGTNLVFAGDQRPRLPSLLEGKGVRRVIVS